MIRTRTVAAVAATATLGLALTACGGTTTDSKSSGGANGTGTLTLGAIVPLTTGAASGANWANESFYTQAVYDSLLRESPDAKIEPGLATSWSYNNDKTVLTMKLRTDVKFTDGTPFNADAAAKNVLRFRDGTSTNRSFLRNVKDAKAVDGSTLQITLTQPDPALLTYLAQNAGAQESPKNFGAPDEKTHPVGSGPYMIDTAKTVIGSKYVYSANPNYWDKANQHFANLVVNVYSTAPVQVNAIRGGQVDGLFLASNDVIDQVKASGFSTYTSEPGWMGLLLLDRDGKVAPPLKDVRVRQAINYAIDGDAILKSVGKGYGTPTAQIFNRNTAAYDPALDSSYPFDPAKAKQLLADAGYSGGFTLNMPEIQTGSTAVFDLIKQYLNDVGITVNYTTMTAAQALQEVPLAKYAATFFRLQADPTVWQTTQFELLPSATWNPFHVADPTIQSLARTIQTGNDADAAAAAKKLDQYVVQQAWFDPWYRPQNIFVGDSKIKVVPQSDNAIPYLQNITHS